MGDRERKWSEEGREGWARVNEGGGGGGRGEGRRNRAMGEGWQSPPRSRSREVRNGEEGSPGSQATSAHPLTATMARTKKRGQGRREAGGPALREGGEAC